MGTRRTKRKNLQKRRKRRLFAAIAAEIRASVSLPTAPLYTVVHFHALSRSGSQDIHI
jgi:hypothetical protein